MSSPRDPQAVRGAAVSVRGLIWVTREFGGRFARALPYVAIFGCGFAMIFAVVAHGNLMYDFRGGLYNAGVAILHGHGFFRPEFLSHQAAILRAGGIAQGELDTDTFSIPVYPAFANVLIVPLALLPFVTAALVYSCLSLVAMIVGLRLLGVRDWRCIVIALLSWPFLFGALLGAVGPFLVLGAGVAWQWRERIWPPALAIAAIVAAKVFPWPLGVWLLITRRWRAAAACAVTGLVITLGAWAIIGFDGMAQYPQMLSNMSLIQEDRAVSLVTVLVVLGVPSGVASACAIVAGLTLLALAWRLARDAGGDRKVFGLAVIAALTATPIVWEHYMVLLFVPVALASPRLSRLWLVPLITPLIDLVPAVLGAGTTKKAHPYSFTALREAVVWLAVESIVAVHLCTTPAQRRAVLHRLRGRAPRPSLSLLGPKAPASATVSEIGAHEGINA